MYNVRIYAIQNHKGRKVHMEIATVWLAMFGTGTAEHAVNMRYTQNDIIKIPKPMYTYSPAVV